MGHVIASCMCFIKYMLKEAPQRDWREDEEISSKKFPCLLKCILKHTQFPPYYVLQCFRYITYSYAQKDRAKEKTDEQEKEC
jgi:hypothetical protein